MNGFAGPCTRNSTSSASQKTEGTLCCLPGSAADAPKTVAMGSARNPAAAARRRRQSTICPGRPTRSSDGGKRRPRWWTSEPAGAGDAHRVGRRGQDPPGSGRGRTGSASYPDGVWLVELAPLAHPSLLRGGSSPSAGSARGARRRSGWPPLPTYLHDKRHAAAAGQLRAPGCGLRRPGRHAAARCAAPADPRHQPGGLVGRRRAVLPRALAQRARPPRRLRSS